MGGGAEGREREIYENRFVDLMMREDLGECSAEDIRATHAHALPFEASCCSIVKHT